MAVIPSTADQIKRSESFFPYLKSIFAGGEYPAFHVCFVVAESVTGQAVQEAFVAGGRRLLSGSAQDRMTGPLLLFTDSFIVRFRSYPQEGTFDVITRTSINRIELSPFDTISDILKQTLTEGGELTLTIGLTSGEAIKLTAKFTNRKKMLELTPLLMPQSPL